MGLKLITAPADLPVSLEEAKAHLRVDHSTEDDLIEAMLRAAIAHVDGAGGFLGRALIDQTWELILDEFPDDEVQIPLPPLLEIVSIKYDDGDGVEQTLDEDTYTVDSVSEPGWVLPVSSWPMTFDAVNAVRIRFRAGYLDQSVSPAIENVPADIKAAIKLIVGTLYAHRETVITGTIATMMPWSAEQLLRRRRVDLSMA